MNDNDRDLDLNATMALTQRLLGEALPAAASGAEDKPGRLGQNLRYWLWRAGGRKRAQAKDTAHVSRLLDNYEIEMERLREGHGRDLLAQKQAHDRVIQEIEATHQRALANLRVQVVAEAEAGNERLRHELGRERQRIAQLEQLVAEFQRVYQGELVKARAAGRAEGQAALDQAADRLTVLEEELAAQQARHAEELRYRLEEEAARAEIVAAALRAELADSRAQAEARLDREREEWRQRAEAERTDLVARLDRAALDQALALEQAAGAHQAELAALRTRHAEELAEIRTAGEWSLSDAKRQIADLRLRLNEQEDSHAEEVDTLRRQHKAELAQWLERFEQAQAHQEIRHAGEYAGSQQALSQDLEAARADIARLVAELEQARARLAATVKSLAEAEARADHLADELAAALRPAASGRRHGGEDDPAAVLAREREAHARLLEQWRDELNTARAAAQAARVDAERARAELSAERQHGARQLAALGEQLHALRDGGERSTLQQVELDRLREEHTLALARLRLDGSRRIAELERLLAQAQRQPAAAMAETAEVTEPAAPPSADDWPARFQAALDRAERAEAEARLAANKVEVLKDALALAKARPNSHDGGAGPVADHRFRDAKRAFARAFHPDQGGREHPDKAALFLEFWPEFERIEKGGD